MLWNITSGFISDDQIKNANTLISEPLAKTCPFVL